MDTLHRTGPGRWTYAVLSALRAARGGGVSAIRVLPRVVFGLGDEQLTAQITDPGQVDEFLKK